ncbi:MAG TPA: DUF3375 domain-containing protein [Pseudonocardiaceae bacterium]|jgi:hypothetical protein
MRFEDLDVLRRHHAAWRLLRAENVPFVLGFLGGVFIEDNVRAITETELAGRLDDELYALNSRLGEGTFPKAAKAYLDDWSAPDVGWLRKYYPPASDEANYDATPAVEKAYAWVTGLRDREFVGTESRLNTVFDLLRQIVFGTETDPAARLVELRRRRLAIDKEIADVEAGRFSILEPAAQRDRYEQFAGTAWSLLADFREVEDNFRSLDRRLRAKITAWEGAKGDLLDDVLGDRNSITASDQGRTFQAFFDFLLSPDRQAEFVELLDRVHQLGGIGHPDRRLLRVHHAWLDAGERAQATVRLLSEQLRRFLDDEVWLENKRVMDILREIETTAVTFRDIRDPDVTCEIDGTVPAIVLPTERPLYRPVDKVPLDSDGIVEADDELDPTVLFEQVFVDRERLCRTIRAELTSRTQVGLADVVARNPIEQGLAELITYLSLDDDAFDIVFDESTREHVEWLDEGDRVRRARVPRVTYARFERGPETR